MRTRNYEAMFLLDNNVASADFDAAAANVDSILEKHGATLVQKEKWDERKLAYEIKGHRRATYYLVYFTADPLVLEQVDEDVHLNEVILRHLTLALDMPIEEHIKVLADERERLAEDSRRNSLSGWGDSRRNRRDRKDRDSDGGGGGGGGGDRGDGGPKDAPKDAPKGDAPKGDAPKDAPKADAPKEAGGDAAADAAPVATDAKS